MADEIIPWYSSETVNLSPQTGFRGSKTATALKTHGERGNKHLAFYYLTLFCALPLLVYSQCSPSSFTSAALSMKK